MLPKGPTGEFQAFRNPLNVVVNERESTQSKFIGVSRQFESVAAPDGIHRKLHIELADTKPRNVVETLFGRAKTRVIDMGVMTKHELEFLTNKICGIGNILVEIRGEQVQIAGTLLFPESKPPRLNKK